LLPFQLDEEGNPEALGGLDDEASQQLIAAFRQEFVGRPIEERPVAFFPFIFASLRQTPTEHMPGLVQLYRDVRSLLERLPRMMPPQEALTDGYQEVQVEVTHYAGVSSDGRFYDQPDPRRQAFITVIQGVDDLTRIRRCPVCGCWFYALRRNTKACRPHLALARVRRSRDVSPNKLTERRRQYEENRKTNRLTKQYRLTRHKGLQTRQAKIIAAIRKRTVEAKDHGSTGASTTRQRHRGK
jgi:hypothetical protein